MVKITPISELIKEFWTLSETRELYKFNFREFFEFFKKELHDKLAGHGLLTFKDYLNHVKKFYDFNVLTKFNYSTHDGTVFSVDKIIKAIFKPRYDYFWENYCSNKSYIKLSELYDEIDRFESLSLQEKVKLVDKCINAEHNTSSIINVNIHELRKKVEKLLVDPVFGILTRAGLEEQIKTYNPPFNVAWLDFNNIKELNASVGYEWVNKRMRLLFKSFNYPDVMVARWFSGDEIVFITKLDINDVIKNFRYVCGVHGFGFKYKLFRDIQSLNEIKGL